MVVARTGRGGRRNIASKEDSMKLIQRAFVALCALGFRSALAAYPERPIQLIPVAAGGAPTRPRASLASLLEKELGQPVNVVNRTGGSGVVGHSAIAQAAPDGWYHRPHHS